jgi:hypothetical protein
VNAFPHLVTVVEIRRMARLEQVHRSR